LGSLCDHLAVLARVLQRIQKDRAEQGEAVRPLLVTEVVADILEDKGPQLADDELPVAVGVADLVQQVLKPRGKPLIAGHHFLKRPPAQGDFNSAGGLCWKLASRALETMGGG
jgi:hypothetical protein